MLVSIIIVCNIIVGLVKGYKENKVIQGVIHLLEDRNEYSSMKIN